MHSTSDLKLDRVSNLPALRICDLAYPRRQEEIDDPQRARRRLTAWLYRSAPVFYAGLFFAWVLVAHEVWDAVAPARLAAWSLLVLGALCLHVILWDAPRRPVKSSGPLPGSLFAWREALGPMMWVTGFAWGSCAFLVLPYAQAAAVPDLWLTVPVLAVFLALPCLFDEQTAPALVLPVLLCTMTSQVWHGSADWSVALRLCAVSTLSLAVLCALHLFVRHWAGRPS